MTYSGCGCYGYGASSSWLWSASRDPVPWSVQIATPPTGEPITRDELLTFARIVPGDEEPTVADQCLTAARQQVERDTGLSLVTTELDCYCDALPTNVVELPSPPLQAVTRVEWYDDSHVGHVLDPTAYSADGARIPARLVLRSDVSRSAARRYQGWRVRQTVGYVPAAILAARGRTARDSSGGALMVFETQTNAPPKSGELRLDQSDATRATRLYVADQGSDGSDVRTAALELAVDDRVVLADASDTTSVVRFRVTSPPIGGNKYTTIPVVYLDGDAVLVDGQAIRVSEPTLDPESPVPASPRVLPPLLKQATLLLASHFLTTGRDLAIVGTIVAPMPMGYAEAIAPYRLELLA